jgi:16S rRNA (uracil1498-N3)-methyltransferase
MRDPEHHLFFSRDLQGDTVRLDAEESRHAARVLRLRPGDTLRVTDGTGVVRVCALTACAPGQAAARVLSAETAPPPSVSLSLYVGMPERTAFELLVECVTALGAVRIVPVVCEYCQEQWWKHSWEKHAARLERKMISAAKQSLNPYLPVLGPPAGFSDALGGVTGTLVVADRRPYEPCDVAWPAAAEHVDAFVGPPGGFSPRELAALADRRAVPVAVSHHRLRTELAAIALAALLMARR